MLTVGIIGDFDPGAETHRAINEALRHAAQALGTTVTATWLPTSEPSTGAVERVLGPFDALWAAPGSPYRDMDGALRGIQFARERGWPFLGTKHTERTRRWSSSAAALASTPPIANALKVSPSKSRELMVRGGACRGADEPSLLCGNTVRTSAFVQTRSVTPADHGLLKGGEGAALARDR
jgi:hypothetical protein